ncbi:MAG TPA: DUF998 domain-containing protein, partial [Candidatus Saccharimonadales bacterium]|nr:DUF998 domain-containing protein [Candidatus Saccharimonadales bacterium]
MGRPVPKWLKYGIVALLALLYNGWILESLLNPRMPAAPSLISELSALTQPHHQVFQALDIVAGFLTLALCGFVWQLTRGLAPRVRWLLTGLFAFVGIDSIVDALLPISCAPSVDMHCYALAPHILITTAHGIESNIAGTAVALLPAVWWWQHRARHRVIEKISLWFAGIQIILGIIALTVRLSGKDSYGIIQRIYEGGVGLWISTIVGTAILRQPA